jgi:glucosamine-6-phosphate deaminase
MKLTIGKDKLDMAQKAADAAAEKIRKAIAEKGEARIIVATGASQFEFLQALVKEEGIDWTKVTGFHLDEYVGIPVDHKASFRGYMRERFVSQTPQPLKVFNEVNGEAEDTDAEIARLEELIRVAPIDVACIGFGENGHIAFNDPPADFDSNRAYKVVPLDEKCRMQQVGEGWFPDLAAVPTHAFSMTVKQIMWSKAIVCTCPDERKAEAVRNCLEGCITNMVPGTILQMHPDCQVFIDPPAASLLAK